MPLDTYAPANRKILPDLLKIAIALSLFFKPSSNSPVRPYKKEVASNAEARAMLLLLALASCIALVYESFAFTKSPKEIYRFAMLLCCHITPDWLTVSNVDKALL